MKKVIIFVLFTLIIMFPMNVDALSCSYEDKAVLRKKASNIMPSYTYTESNDSVLFSVTLTNLSQDLYIVDKTTNKRYNYNGSSELTIKGYEAGVKVQYEIYTTNSDCFTKYLTIKYVNLPNYNKYYKDPLCVGKESYSVCYKWNKVDITYDEFKERVKKIYNEQTKEEEINEEIKETLFDKIYNFLHDYYVFIIVGLVLITFSIIFFRNRKNNFGF